MVKKSNHRSKKPKPAEPLAHELPTENAAVRLKRNLALSLDNLESIEKGAKVALEDLILYETRTRKPKTINHYRLLRRTSEPPPLDTIKVETGEEVVVDGVTRYLAAALDGAPVIACNRYKGTWEQVKILALKLNQHGEKIPTEDLKREIDRLDEEAGDSPLSSREMGELLGISHTTVAGHRAARGKSTLESIKGMRAPKGPDEKRADMVKSVNRMIDEQGDEILHDLFASLPEALRKRVLNKLTEAYPNAG